MARHNKTTNKTNKVNKFSEHINVSNAGKHSIFYRYAKIFEMRNNGFQFTKKCCICNTLTDDFSACNFQCGVIIALHPVGFVNSFTRTDSAAPNISPVWSQGSRAISETMMFSRIGKHRGYKLMVSMRTQKLLYMINQSGFF